MNANVVDWFEIYVDDIERARKFYQAVFGKPMMDLPTPDPTKHKMVAFAWVEGAPNAAGALVWMPEMKAGGNSTVVYFMCEDCAVEESRVVAAGGQVMMPKFSIGEFGFCSWCIDCEGNYFGLHSIK